MCHNGKSITQCSYRTNSLTRDLETKILKLSGKYYVQLPDGRVQVVKYRVTKDSGYVADVSYINPSAKTLPAIVPYNNSPRFDPLSENFIDPSPAL